MTDREFAYIPYSAAEAPGRDRDEAVRNAFALMDRFAKGRRLTAAERYDVLRVRKIGHGWWRVLYGPKRRAG